MVAVGDGEFGADAEGRRRLRQVYRGLGLSDRELVAPMAAEMLRHGRRPRQAWRLANDLTQEAVAHRFNERVRERDAPMVNSRIAAYESWPNGRSSARPTVEVLEILAEIYGTTWDQLVDAEDIVRLSPHVLSKLADAVSARVAAADPAGRSSGRAMPSDVSDFVGRSGQLDEIHRRIVDHLQQRKPAVHVIAGPMGVGKTALARQARTAFARRYPDRSFWEDLHGHTPGTEPRDPADVLEQLLLQVGVSPESIESDLAGRAHQWQEVMRNRRSFIVFDNALDSKQVRYLQPQSPGCFVLITSRAKLTGLAGAVPLPLEVMGDDEARELLVRLACLGPDHDEAAVSQILRTAGRLPLAIKLIAGQIANYGPEMLAECAAEFADHTAALRSAPPDHPGGESAAEHILGWFTAEDQSLYAAFELSYDRLSDPLQRRVLRLIGWFPGPEITAEAVALMARISLAQSKSLLRSLSEAGFIDRSVRVGHCYRAHDVVQLCARRHAEQEDPPSDHAATMTRLIDGYLEQAHEHGVPAGRAEHIRRRTRLPEVFEAAEPDTKAAYEWLTVERANLLACIAAARPTPRTAELAMLLTQPLWYLGCWTDARRLCGTLHHIAVTAADRSAEVGALLQLGRIDQLGGCYDDSDTSLRHALAIANETGDRQRRAEILCELGQTAWLDGAHAEAEEYYTEALELAREHGYRPAECDAHRGLGHVRRLECRYGEATAHLVTAARIATALDDPWRMASVRWGHGEVARRLGDNATATADYTAALRTARPLGDEITVGDALRGLGHLTRLVGDPIAATYFAESLEISTRLYDRYGKTWSLWGLGNLDRDAGRWEAARRCYAEGLEIAEAIKVSLARVDHHRGLGHIERECGDHAAANAHYRASLRIAEQVNDPNGQGDALRALGSVMRLQGRTAEACELLRAALRCYEPLGVPAAERTRKVLRDYGCE
ncbi:tetratricopeptide repeat protein [Nocardia sp. NPDC051833]|uniref:tetratricopeptide repeat protein n=1 Tax=Nocardia sp. NPDC051833 TaxID=3155674 RepID=UPI00342ECEC5